MSKARVSFYFNYAFACVLGVLMIVTTDPFFAVLFVGQTVWMQLDSLGKRFAERTIHIDLKSEVKR